MNLNLASITTLYPADIADGFNPTRLSKRQVGEGWELLNEGEPLQPGDGYLHPDHPGVWIDYVCRPALFRGGGKEGTWYYTPTRDYVHTWPWRRRSSLKEKVDIVITISDEATPKETAPA